MAPLVSLAASLGAFTAAALMLGLIAGASVFAFEELIGRALVNRAAVFVWTRSRGPDARWLPRKLQRWYPLPYKQLTGAIASVFQVRALSRDDVKRSPDESELLFKDPDRDLQTAFARIGARILGIELPPDATAKDDNLSESFLAERALDDLQANLAVTWTRARYFIAAAVTAVVFTAVALTHAAYDARWDFSNVLANLPLIWIISVLFAPIFRDLIETLSARQR
jgi:hypothetical protein